MNTRPSVNPPEKLLELQRQFAAHLRSPDEHPAPSGVEDRRMAIYRRLFFGNLSNLFARNFPVMRRILADPDWNELIRSFMSRHRATTPLFPQIGEELVLFLRSHSPPHCVTDRPWLPELAQWEYTETRARLCNSQLPPLGDHNPNWSTGAPVVNPTLQVGCFQWPVHRISPNFVPTAKHRATFILLAFRNRADKVSFMQINEMTLALIHSMKEEPGLPGHLHVRKLIAGRPTPGLMEAALLLLHKLFTHQVLVGHVTAEVSQPTFDSIDQDNSLPGAQK